MTRPPLSDVAREIEEEGAWDQFIIEIGLGLISPFMVPFTLFNAYHDWYHYGPIYQGDDPPPRRFDPERTRLHGVSWGLASVASWGYHAWMHPGKYPGLRASGDLVKLTGHWAMHSPTVHRAVGLSARVAPVVGVTYVAVEASSDVLTMQLQRAASIQTGGQSTPPSKPWWMPLPVFVALYG